MDLLTVMWRVAIVIGGVVGVLGGAVFMLSAVFMTDKKGKKMYMQGYKIRHRIVAFILGYLLLCFGVYLIWLLF